MATASTSTADRSNGDEARLRASTPSVDWLTLIDPVHETIIGTNGNDTLAAAADGDVVEGLAGDDDLSSTFNRTALIGGRDSDTLNTNLTLTAQPHETLDAVIVQLGGAGDDTMDATTDLRGDRINPGEPRQELSAHILVDGGSGNDLINATAKLGAETDAIINIFQVDAFGGSGDDTINAIADNQGQHDADNVVRTVVDGGSGSDHITAFTRSVGFGSALGSATALIDGGDGDDFLESTTFAFARYDEPMVNELHGGRGDDTMLATSAASSNFRDTTSINELWGEGGNDTMTSIMRGEKDTTNHLDGGVGHDVLTATTSASSPYDVKVLNLLDGGIGEDTLTSELLVQSGVDNVDAENRLNGGADDDTLVALLSVTIPYPAPSGEGSRAENHLDGGNGNDTLTATVTADSFVGTSFLYGGGGNDTLSVIGGKDNVLDGGAGRDTLVGGSGDDHFFGGFGADAFVFGPPTGHDTLLDFETGRDWIDLTAFAPDDIHSISDLTIDTMNGDSVIHFDADNDITLKGVTALKASDFWFA